MLRANWLTIPVGERRESNIASVSMPRVERSTVLGGALLSSTVTGSREALVPLCTQFPFSCSQIFLYDKDLNDVLMSL